MITLWTLIMGVCLNWAIPMAIYATRKRRNILFAVACAMCLVAMIAAERMERAIRADERSKVQQQEPHNG